MTVMNLLTCTALISGLALPFIVQAKAPNLAAEINTCSQISQDQARLTCFDALTQSKILPAETTSKAVTSEKLPLTEQQIDEFAKGHVEKSKEELAKEINSITLTVSELTKTLRGQWKIVFENGQKWQQKDGQKLKLQVGLKVSITKGALGAVYLKKEQSNKRIKVKRVK